jgi:hypothetical protein
MMAMNLTDYHAKYFAHELTKSSASDNIKMFAGVLAAHNAFRDPADDVKLKIPDVPT